MTGHSKSRLEQTAAAKTLTILLLGLPRGCFALLVIGLGRRRAIFGVAVEDHVSNRQVCNSQVCGLASGLTHSLTLLSGLRIEK
jgi:hypothetical protein